MDPQAAQPAPAPSVVATPPLQTPVSSSPFGRIALYSVLFLAVGFVGGFYTPGLLNPAVEVPVAVPQTKDLSHALTSNYLNSTYGFSFNYPKAYTHILQTKDYLWLSDASTSLAITITPKTSVKYKTQKEACAGVNDDGGCALSQDIMNATKKILDEATTTSKAIIPLLDVEGDILPTKDGFVMTALRRSWQSGEVYAYAVMLNKFGDMIVLEQALTDNDVASAERNPAWTTFKNVAKTLEVTN
ncbi:MAG: hypothetical protein RIQ41_515 [Candidatus Parcubacteria bacterium]|jgi:hypothetical protein